MPKNRPKFQREADLLKTGELCLQGKTQVQIAQIVGVVQSTVARDLKELQKRWKEKSIN